VIILFGNGSLFQPLLHPTRRSELALSLGQLHHGSLVSFIDWYDGLMAKKVNWMPMAKKVSWMAKKVNWMPLAKKVRCQWREK
jgi:hypothetical protein